MAERDRGRLFSDQLREWADAGIARIEREARRDFAELVKEAILKSLSESRYICFNHRVKWERSEVRAEVITVIDDLLREIEDD